MKKMWFKPILVLCMAIILVALLVTPSKAYVHIPGCGGQGPKGYACICPCFPYYNCGCAIIIE